MKVFDRSENKMNTIYDPKTYQPIRRYRLVREQIEFLVEIEKHIAGMNVLSTPDEYHEYYEFIKKIVRSGWYGDKQIDTLLHIRDKFKFLYLKKNKSISEKPRKTDNNNYITMIKNRSSQPISAGSLVMSSSSGMHPSHSHTYVRPSQNLHMWNGAKWVHVDKNK